HVAFTQSLTIRLNSKPELPFSAPKLNQNANLYADSEYGIYFAFWFSFGAENGNSGFEFSLIVND
ncbi:unnamed protein product, partial [Rotaria sp. Silwood2]